MRVDRLVLGGLQTNCWVVGPGPGPVIVIDPAADAPAVLDVVGERAVAIVVLTHGHFDHLGAVDDVLSATGASFAIHAADADMVSDAVANGSRLFGLEAASAEPDRLLADGDRLEVGDVSLEVLHTPGHTPGCMCLYTDGHLFSGDTVFAGSVGRTDLPGGDSRALRHSILEKIVPLPDDTLVHPGHGPDTTVGRERSLNPFFPRC